MISKKDFLKIVTVIYDSREQKNDHIISGLAGLGIKTERKKLDFGDYSFRTDTRDFSMSCVIERKANVDELYQNTMYDPGRIEKELKAGALLARQFILLVENIGSFDDLKKYQLPLSAAKEQGRKKLDIGAFVAEKIASYQAGSGYGIRTLYVRDPKETHLVMLSEFYYFWKNYCELVAARSSA